MADSHAKHHDYHLVDPSPWPAFGSLSAFILAVGTIVWFKSLNGGSGVFGITGPWLFGVGIMMTIFTMFVWWKDVIREANRGDHTPVVQLHLRYGMIMFIASEVMFFVAWFWAFFDASLFPGSVTGLENNTSQIVGMTAREQLTGGVWPPKPTGDGRFTATFDPWGLPMVNTLILLLSGTTVTWAHHALLNDDRKGLVRGLAVTVVLGFVFTLLQAYEYGHAAFGFSNHIYGATFFMATGFHGAHVMIGTIFLAVCLVRAMRGAFTPKQHFGFEAAAWYWHFVDVVWLFLFVFVYVWAAGTPAPH